MLWPHEVLEYLFNDVKLTISLEERQEFWQEARSRGSRGPSIPQVQMPTIRVACDGARLQTQTEKIVGVFMNLVLFRPRMCKKLCIGQRLGEKKTDQEAFHWSA